MTILRQPVPSRPPGSLPVPFMGATLDRRGLLWGVAFAGFTTLLVFLGSNGLRGFDGALAGYCFSALFAIFGITYRYVVWLQRPPTRAYWVRGWQLFFRRGRRLKNLGLLFAVLWDRILAQRFIAHRSVWRWVSHELIFVGCVLAILVTFPLSFGWVHFESALSDPRLYLPVLFGVKLNFAAFWARSFIGWVVFHLLDISAILCLGGIAIALGRRVRDEAELAVQRLDHDLIPLFLLFAVSVTGLLLTVSNTFMAGKFYYFLTTTHAVTVMLWLLFLPFGKFFHIFQRVANMGVWFYKDAGANGPAAECRRCGAPFESQLQNRDLKAILPELGFDYRLPDGGNWQDVCPQCRRKLVTESQFRAAGRRFL
ncbi:MAG TPA: hypothetical protein VHN99_06930 [Deinococcales bacterium]|nr:hypothetical protein [Deinococcales bacterium]